MIGKNNDIITNPDQISNAFCNFFTNVGPKSARSIPPSNKQFSTYLQNCPSQHSNSLFMRPTDENEIQQIITSLQPKKSSGYDNLSQLHLKIFGEQVWENSASRIENCENYTCF